MALPFAATHLFPTFKELPTARAGEDHFDLGRDSHLVGLGRDQEDRKTLFALPFGAEEARRTNKFMVAFRARNDQHRIGFERELGKRTRNDAIGPASRASAELAFATIWCAQLARTICAGEFNGHTTAQRGDE